MENFAPGLRESILSLTDALRLIVFFVCVVGLVLQIQQARADVVLDGLAVIPDAQGLEPGRR